MSPKPRCSRAAAAPFLAVALLLAAAGSACRLDESVPLAIEDRLGGIDPQRIVAIGDDYAAGAADGALYAGAQGFSLPALLAAHLSGDPLFQPLVSDPGLALDETDAGRLQLISLVPLELERATAGAPLVPSPGRPFDNLGVPGALVSEALIAESSATSVLGNPFYDLVLGGRGTFVEQAAALDPTLVLLWIGTSDVMRYVVAGGDPDLAPGLPTPVGTFANAYEALLDAVLATADQVVLFTIPDPRSMPLVRAVPGIVLDPDTGQPVEITVIVPVIDPETGEPVLDPVTGDTLFAQQQSTVPLLGPAGPLAPADFALLSALPLLDEGIGVPASVGGTDEPLPDRAVFDVAEQADVGAAIAGYNQAIVALAAEHDLPLVDVHALVEALAGPTLVSDGILLSADYATGQAFSLDGARFTPKGYGVVANLVIDALDARYGGSVPHLRTDGLPGTPLLGLP
jgi:lysophospholipase L1-like esterase